LTIEVIEKSESAVCGDEGRTWQARIGGGGTKACNLGIRLFLEEDVKSQRGCGALIRPIECMVKRESCCCG
jgi:hypothetical protein